MVCTWSWYGVKLVVPKAVCDRRRLQTRRLADSQTYRLAYRRSPDFDARFVRFYHEKRTFQNRVLFRENLDHYELLDGLRVTGTGLADRRHPDFHVRFVQMTKSTQILLHLSQQENVSELCSFSRKSGPLRIVRWLKSHRVWLLGSVAKCRGSWVVGRGRGSWVWVNVVSKTSVAKKKMMK